MISVDNDSSPASYKPWQSSIPSLTSNTTDDPYMSPGYPYGRSSVPLMNQDAYFSNTNTSASTTSSNGRFSAPIVSPDSTIGPSVIGKTSTHESVTLSGLGGDVHMAFSQSSASAVNVKNTRNDLLSAADSITGAMSALVKELSSGRKLCNLHI